MANWRILVFFLLIAHHVSIAQTHFPFYSIKRLTTDDGLSQGSNYFMFEDSRGFMWITGNDALNRYDGTSVKVYNLSKYLDHCPVLQQGYGFAEDDSANLYIGSVRGLYKYSRKSNRFSLIKIYTLSGNDVAMPFGFYKGKVWCFNLYYQLASYDVNTGEVIYHAINSIPPITSVHIYDNLNNPFYNRWPVIDKTGCVWITGKKIVVSFQTVTGEIHEYKPSTTNLTEIHFLSKRGLLS